MDIDSDLEDNLDDPLDNELKYQPLVYQKDQSSDEEDIDEVVEDVDQVSLNLFYFLSPSIFRITSTKKSKILMAKETKNTKKLENTTVSLFRYNYT
jgi:hypothetical protein